MFNYIYNIITSKNPNLTILKVALILALILFLLMMHRLSAPPYEKHMEGFTQMEQFVLKENQNVYDNFYAEVYDGLNDTQNRSQKELIEIIKMTEPSTKYSVFLDVGSGTGYMVNQLKEAGYTAYGIDKSTDMIDYAETKNPSVEIKNGDVMDPMAFERSTFSHILCTNLTLYLFEDKMTFFRNSYYWLKQNGYLIIHLVEPDKFELIVPKNNQQLTPVSPTASSKRKTDATVHFHDFKYSASYKLPEANCANKCVTFKETFVDRDTNHIRQNEQTLHMNKIDDVLEMASNTGFIFHGKVNMKPINGDKHQYLYIFERPM